MSLEGLDMEDSILLSIKKLISFENDYDAFDADLILLINSYISILCQIGVGPSDGFKIISSSETWLDFLGEDESKLEMAKTYIFTRVKPVFDPPTNSFVTSTFKEEAKEIEWRLSVAVDEIDSSNNQNDEEDS